MRTELSKRRDELAKCEHYFDTSHVFKLGFNACHAELEAHLMHLDKVKRLVEGLQEIVSLTKEPTYQAIHVNQIANEALKWFEQYPRRDSAGDSEC